MLVLSFEAAEIHKLHKANTNKWNIRPSHIKN